MFQPSLVEFPVPAPAKRARLCAGGYRTRLKYSRMPPTWDVTQYEFGPSNWMSENSLSSRTLSTGDGLSLISQL